MWSGIPRASQTWMWPIVGGLLMTQFATKARPSRSSGSGWDTAGQHDLIMRFTMAVFFGRVVGCLASPQTDPPVWTLNSGIDCERIKIIKMPFPASVHRLTADRFDWSVLAHPFELLCDAIGSACTHQQLRGSNNNFGTYIHWLSCLGSPSRG